MRVELNVDLRPARPVAAEKPVVDPEIRAEALRRDREERWLQRIALARVIDAGIASGTFADLASVARRCGVSRARVSRVVTQ
ncbi:MAG TPA: hypothetical protein PLL30_16255 [Candidatus Krumholzibacteria bacterium]|nr:hypothetical protein [Candidatus Krumholzibacteria bacterium]HPD73324.1 hypothetical protein [Candidatus Krumholzibacteria bacterium]HRY42040.1 hypothetical protein [Candidatus Krumholzibacteria bacterium]